MTTKAPESKNTINDVVNVVYYSVKGLEVESRRTPRSLALATADKMAEMWSILFPGGHCSVQEMDEKKRSRVVAVSGEVDGAGKRRPLPCVHNIVTLDNLCAQCGVDIGDENEYEFGAVESDTTRSSRTPIGPERKVGESLEEFLRRSAERHQRESGYQFNGSVHVGRSAIGGVNPRRRGGGARRSKDAIPTGVAGVDRPYVTRVVVARTRVKRPPSVKSAEVPHYLVTVE